MLPPSGAAGGLLAAADTIDIPVMVRWGPLAPQRRPRRTTIDGVWAPWPGLPMPPTGQYLVRTTWRDVLDAATCVGRDPIAWLTAVPQLAYAEIVARCSPLIAYLGRTPHHGGPVPGAHQLQANVVYQHGTESSALGTFGYRLGMTMAEWAGQALLRLGPTVHAEAVPPVHAGPGWTTAAGLPDLVAYRPGSSLPWLIEAKGRRRLGLPDLRKGATQLLRPGLMIGPHVRMLCGTSVEHRVFVTLDLEHVKLSPASVPTGGPDTSDPDADDVLALARARMLTYLLLRGTPTAQLRVTPVGESVAQPRSARTAGAVLLLESDPSTGLAREDARMPDRYRSRPPQQRFDLLTARVPGTDLILGMSRRLFAACEQVAATDQALAAVVSDEVSMPDGDSDAVDADVDLERDQWRARSEGLYWQLQRQQRQALASRVRARFDQGEQAGWEELINAQPPLIDGPPSGYLEAATADTYLAVHRRTATQASG
ncbi:hypothetical protein ACQP2P_11495 [Dactylosporangium sp. CA-139114]|uniref:hypothetical protein n=1 Tax=Dactylosporangium sp. CA-139114 TaxID=3239931 RepID=UPI003D9687A6